MNAADFRLDPRLLEAGFELGRLTLSHLLLMNNAALPWFILVPRTSTTELCDLEPDVHQQLFEEVNLIARLVRAEFVIDKLNIATLGNIVPQMHIHVVGRRRDDYCWPGGVWGVKNTAFYAPAELRRIGERVSAQLGHRLTVAAHG